MMTTGYDCPDILNLGLFRPIFSPTDFIQIKGRGTRKHDFREELFDAELRDAVKEPRKKAFKLYLPKPNGHGNGGKGGGQRAGAGGTYEHLGQDILSTIKEETIGYEGMKIDRMFYEKFDGAVRDNPVIAAAVEAGQWDRVIDYVNREVFDKPNEYFSLEKLRQAAAVDRRLG